MRERIVYRLRVLVSLLVLFVGICGVTPGEVSIDSDASGEARSLVLMYELLAGGDNGAPWPIFRPQIPAAWILNPTGSDGPNPDGWPSLGWDPVGDTPEVTWARHDGKDYEIVISRWETDHWTAPAALTANAVDDLDPEIAYAPDGTARLTFWSGSEVFILTRSPGGNWSVPEQVDAGDRSSVAGTPVERVAYQRAVSGNSAEIIAAERVDGWAPVVLAATPFAGFDGDGDLDVRLEAQEGKTWVVWEDSAAGLGWCELLPGGTWSARGFEPVSGPDDEEAARLRIKLQILR